MIALLYLVFGKDKAFRTRDVFAAAQHNEALRTFISRSGLVNGVAMGVYLRAIEGERFTDLALWCERQSRHGHTYSLRAMT